MAAKFRIVRTLLENNPACSSNKWKNHSSKVTTRKSSEYCLFSFYYIIED